MEKQSNKTTKRIAIVVDDEKRNQLIEWSYFNKTLLKPHNIIANDEIALILSGTLTVPVTSLPHGNFGGYRQLATMIGNNEIDLLICMASADKGTNFRTNIIDLVFLATEKNVMVASNEATANVILESLKPEPGAEPMAPGPQSLYPDYVSGNLQR